MRSPSPISFAPEAPHAERESKWLNRPSTRILGVLSALFALANALFWSTTPDQIDFRVYLMGARHLTSPLLYATSLTNSPHLPFTYPPFATFLFWPFSLFPLGVAATFWDVCNWAALVALVAVTVRTLRPEASAAGGRTPWPLVGLLIGPAVLLEPMMLNLSYGQINLILVAVVVADLTGHVRFGGHEVPRGVLIGMASAIKLVPLIFIPFLLLTRQWRFARTAGLTFVVCSAVPFITNSRASWQYWTRYVNDQSRIGRMGYVSNQSLLGVLDRWYHHNLSGPLLPGLELLVVILGLLVAARVAAQGRRFLAVLVVADTGLVGSPVTWCHHMVYVLPIILWFWWCPDGVPFARVWASVTTVLFFWAPMWHIPHDGNFDLHEHGWQLVAGASFGVSAVVFLLGVSVWSLRTSRVLVDQ